MWKKCGDDKKFYSVYHDNQNKNLLGWADEYEYSREHRAFGCFYIAIFFIILKAKQMKNENKNVKNWGEVDKLAKKVAWNLMQQKPDEEVDEEGDLVDRG